MAEQNSPILPRTSKVFQRQNHYAEQTHKNTPWWTGRNTIRGSGKLHCVVTHDRESLTAYGVIQVHPTAKTWTPEIDSEIYRAQPQPRKWLLDDSRTDVSRQEPETLAIRVANGEDGANAIALSRLTGTDLRRARSFIFALRWIWPRTGENENIGQLAHHALRVLTSRAESDSHIVGNLLMLLASHRPEVLTTVCRDIFGSTYAATTGLEALLAFRSVVVGSDETP